MRTLVCLLLLALVLSATAGEVKEDRLEQQMLEIAKQLRCTVCQNQSVADSSADIAGDMRVIIREQLAAGKSPDEIINYFVARYGDYVLLKPPMDRIGAVVWLLPTVLFVGISVFAVFFLRRRLKGPLPPAPDVSTEDLARVQAARQHK
jgi:cytochrome c-type biogenesis protein CcmH